MGKFSAKVFGGVVNIYIQKTFRAHSCIGNVRERSVRQISGISYLLSCWFYTLLGDIF